MSRGVDGGELDPRRDLASPRPLRVALPILLAGDLVLTSEHLGPAYLAAVLRRAGARVAIDEATAATLDALVDRIAAFAPDIVGISLTMVSTDDARAFGRALRARLGRGTFIVLGGPVATYLGSDLFGAGFDFADMLIRGEGEVPLLRLCEAIQGGGRLDGVPNACFRSAEGIVETKVVPGVADLDALPFPARDQLERHGRFSYLRVSTSRGCTAHCTFCNAPHTRNRIVPGIKPWRGCSARRVVDEVEHLVATYGANTFDFVDSTFEDPGGGRIGKARVRAIAEEILSRGLDIYYNVCMQARNWGAADRDLIALLRRSGLEKVLIGIESGSADGLARWQKMSTVAENETAIAVLREAGIYVAFGFIMFHPWSSFAEIRENQDFLARNLGQNLRRFTTRLELYPGAEVVDQLEAEGLLLPGFRDSLNPFAYRYRDPRIERFASLVNGLYGSPYQDRGAIAAEPAVFRFETYDIVLHNFISRLKRLYGEEPRAGAILDEFDAAAAGHFAELALYNRALLGHLTDLAERDRLDAAAVASHVEPTELLFRNIMTSLDRLKLLYGRQLRKAGYDLSPISTASPPRAMAG